MRACDAYLQQQPARSFERGLPSPPVAFAKSTASLSKLVKFLPPALPSNTVCEIARPHFQPARAYKLDRNFIALLPS
jgi:hypothetical protein